MAEQQESFFGRGTGWQNPEMEKEKAYGPRRMWIPADDGTAEGKLKSSAKGVFLDGVPFFLFEHQLKIGDSWQNWFSCMQNWNEPCELCDVGKDPDYVGMLSFLSIYQNKKGEWTAAKNLFPMKQKAFKILSDLSQARGGDLTRWVVRIKRTEDPQSPSIGNVFDFQRLIPDEATLIKETTPLLGWIEQMQPRPGRPRLTVAEYLKPFNYEEVFKKPDPKDLARVASRLRYSPLKDSGGRDRGAGPKGDDIPF